VSGRQTHHGVVRTHASARPNLEMQRTHPAVPDQAGEPSNDALTLTNRDVLQHQRAVDEVEVVGEAIESIDRE
jgi:hypothetical protein